MYGCELYASSMPTLITTIWSLSPTQLPASNWLPNASESSQAVSGSAITGTLILAWLVHESMQWSIVASVVMWKSRIGCKM